MKEETNTAATPENIERLLKLYMENNCSDAESAEVRQWLSENISDPALDGFFDDLLAATPPEHDHPSTARVRSRLETLISGSRDRMPLGRRIFRAAGVAAAAAMIAVVLTIQLRPQPEIRWQEEYAAHGQTKTVTLPDGSSVWLNSGSRIFYPSGFSGKTRTIHVDGEVFADVVKDKRRPFVLHAPEVRVEVLGTRFGVKSFAADRSAQVTLVEGSVAMHTGSGEGSTGRVVQVGEMVRYDAGSGRLESYRIDTETYGPWNENRNLCFVNHTLREIVEDLERRFDVHIIIDGDELASSTYYVSFVNNETLDQILGALNRWNTMRITKVNNTIIISSN